MNPPLAFADALVQLKLLTSQTANFSFTDDELTQALQSAWNDSYVCDSIWDSSTNFAVGTWSYNVPRTMTSVQGLYLKVTTTDAPQEIASELYDINAGKIQFNSKAQNWLGTSYTIYVKGLYKLTTDDDLDTAGLVNYTLSLAAFILLKQLALKKTFFFLKTDTTMGDIITAKRDMERDVMRYKQALLREFESI